MGHPVRIEEPGRTYHVTARGNGGQVVYVHDADRVDFLRLLERTSERYAWRCLAYCLMTNHYHLAVEIPRGGLSRGMQALNGGYSRLANSVTAEETISSRTDSSPRQLSPRDISWMSCDTSF
jgi:REP element-mobilizing transposase RayT